MEIRGHQGWRQDAHCSKVASTCVARPPRTAVPRKTRKDKTQRRETLERKSPPSQKTRRMGHPQDYLCRRCEENPGPTGKSRSGLEVADALEYGTNDERKGDGGVFQDFGEFAAFFRGNKFAPGNGFGVSAAAEAAPVDGFGTDANAVGVALKRKFFVAATGHEFGIDAELLRPVAGNAATDGEDAHFFGVHPEFGKGLAVFEG